LNWLKFGESGYFYQVFPIEAVWTSALFLIVGGGSPVLNAVVFAMLADAITPEKRYVG
jgi:hypothetical protein